MTNKILFLAANPTNQARLRLDEEVRLIDKALRSSNLQDEFELETHWAVQIGDLQELLLRYQPDFVHFSGHGSDTGEIILLESNGQGVTVPSVALERLFALLKDNIRCVVLNACFSELQALSIAKHIDAVVGVDMKIDDKAAITFATAFYRALGYGRDIKTAYDLGCNEISIHNIENTAIPQLFGSVNETDTLPNHTHHATTTESPFGTMRPNSPFYIEREADRRCNQILNNNTPFTLYIQAPRQVGKSSLMQKVSDYSRNAINTKVAFVDFERFTQEQLNSAEEFLIELCLIISEELDVAEEIEHYFVSRRRSNIVKCSNYLSKHIIPSIEGSLIVALDEVERVLNTPFQNDFFGMLRTWHNDRARDPNFARMSLFLSSSTEPELFIDNPNRSPFNVAQQVSLADFSQADIEQLNQRHGSPLRSDQLEELILLLSGHPFLTRLSLYLVATEQYSFDELLSRAIDDDGPFINHLNHFWRKLAETPKLQESLQLIQETEKHPVDRRFEQLKGAGLIKRAATKIIMRNQLYARYFWERIRD